ncbi:sigma-70 family RNA polymerase sigma factor [Zavarzinella formosa]|uniref:sigma-70 family RNA polymerase sigma factor n=1 Tax=Zavarzinella formosa TaxID=360055 RepID=UPI0002D92E78|nr:sigma-70 family RNA polymerase sigma factor [Zavarzinella formosa]
MISHIPLAKALAWKFARREGRRVPVDDLFAEALFGLAYANHLFDQSRGVPFKKYAIMVICHRLRHLISGWQRHDREVPLPRLPHEPETEWQPPDREDFQQAGRDMDAAQLWSEVRDTLSARQYEIIQLHYRSGCSLAQIGRRFGISRQRTSQLLAKAQKNLRTRWANHEPEV